MVGGWKVVDSIQAYVRLTLNNMNSYLKTSSCSDIVADDVGFVRSICPKAVEIWQTSQSAVLVN